MWPFSKLLGKTINLVLRIQFDFASNLGRWVLLIAKYFNIPKHLEGVSPKYVSKPRVNI